MYAVDRDTKLDAWTMLCTTFAVILMQIPTTLSSPVFPSGPLLPEGPSLVLCPAHAGPEGSLQFSEALAFQEERIEKG